MRKMIIIIVIARQWLSKHGVAGRNACNTGLQSVQTDGRRPGCTNMAGVEGEYGPRQAGAGVKPRVGAGGLPGRDETAMELVGTAEAPVRKSDQP